MTLASGSIQQNTLKNAIGIVQLRKNTEALSAGRKNITASGRRSPSSRELTQGLLSLTPKEFKQSQAQPIGELRELLHFCHLSTPRISKLKKKKKLHLYAHDAREHIHTHRHIQAGVADERFRSLRTWHSPEKK